ncbi:MAG: LON peptidase substrate-binding domain-containing protein [Chloroflexi bacterium SZAS-1]|jgi:Lon protease-like protein|nr:LON peptidase substrate-binding domain-containing protein [Chloroflexi bacterium SZAS-1]HNP86890.1 LON peptidase substrate-binding domain-containing protein [Kouleothrix sp.]
MTVKLPLFPLNTVLFPGAMIQLHVFEERYRLMVGRCIEQRSPFGVVLLRSGSEVNPNDPWFRQQVEAAGGGDAELNQLRLQLGGDALPYVVGTSAQINIGESARLDDGRYYLIAQGQRRFRIQYFVQRQPYFIASVGYLPEESAAHPYGAGEQLRTVYARYWAAVSALTGTAPPSESLPESPSDLTYWMAHRLNVDNAQKQHWLEADVSTRLREMSAALRAELALLPNGDAGERERGGPGSGSWN